MEAGYLQPPVSALRHPFPVSQVEYPVSVLRPPRPLGKGSHGGPAFACATSLTWHRRVLNIRQLSHSFHSENLVNPLLPNHLHRSSFESCVSRPG